MYNFACELKVDMKDGAVNFCPGPQILPEGDIFFV